VFKFFRIVRFSEFFIFKVQARVTIRVRLANIYVGDRNTGSLQFRINFYFDFYCFFLTFFNPFIVSPQEVTLKFSKVETVSGSAFI